jgi:hypothetical protein
MSRTCIVVRSWDVRGSIDLHRFLEHTSAVSFTCTTLPASHSSGDNSKRPIIPDAVFQAQLEFVRKRQKKGDGGTMALERIPLDPVQLYVCREAVLWPSRDIDMHLEEFISPLVVT